MPSNPPTRSGSFLNAAGATRIVDFELEGAAAEVSYGLLPSSGPYFVTITVIDVGSLQTIATIFQGYERGAKSRRVHRWDGRDTWGSLVPPAPYTIRVEAQDVTTFTRRIDYDLDVVRLGIVSIAAESSAPTGANEWQTVYFRKNGAYAFYATPATGEYVSKAEIGDVSDLDLDDGAPRPPPAVHEKVDEPALEFPPSGPAIYEDDSFNYPLCYLAGAAPRFTVTFGASCTLDNGFPSGCNYPVAGFEIRAVASDEAGAWTTTATSIAPGSTQTLDGPALTLLATKSERHVDWSFEQRAVGAATWSAIPGKFTTTHRIFTILDQPYWATGASGTQYAGPWVEVLDDLDRFATALGVTCDSSDRVVEAFIKGYFGQNGSLTTAIEDVHYDCPSEGGDGGATHYFDWGGWRSRLTRLLNAHANGKFVNCTDCAGSTSAMLSMLGVSGYQMDHLGSMTLNAIWGIGTADYTLDLWSNGGGAGHGFSYHHIITRDGGTTISDACLWVDEDGNPAALPGTPGYNNDRDWNNYESMLATGNVTWYTEPLPKIN